MKERNSFDVPGPNGGLLQFIGYFLKLGFIGFGGPVALVGYMNRDLVEGRRGPHCVTIRRNEKMGLTSSEGGAQ